MNSKVIKKVLVLMAALIVQAAFSNIAYSADTLSRSASQEVVGTDANTTDRYALPPSKVYIEPCEREALRLHPGAIEKQRLLHQHGDFLMRYEILASDGVEWFILCDLATGKIIDAF